MAEPATEKGKKQLVLRLSPKLHRDIAAWAQDDFRSLNGQIEFLLTEALRRRGRGAPDGREADKAEEDS